MGNNYQNMVIIFVPEDQESLVPGILASVSSDHGPFDFNNLMPEARGGGIAGTLDELIKNTPNGGKLKFDPEQFEKAHSKDQRLWGCTSNSIFYDHLVLKDKSWTEELDYHYGYDDQPKSIKLNWCFDTKNGTPDELANRFVQRAADLGLGAMWFYSAPNESKWNPITNNHESQWDIIAESTPNQISETQRIRNAARAENLFNLLEELT